MYMYLQSKKTLVYFCICRKSIDANKNQANRKTGYNSKYLWIRLALIDKQLAKIIDYLVQNWR